ncbi:Tad3p [Sporobolomyces koalae]|uniref:Tad3p n=1 Tax=Sporobolomyces koalae TaxID=500713 RepID=UPI0031772044
MSDLAAEPTSNDQVAAREGTNGSPSSHERTNAPVGRENGQGHLDCTDGTSTRSNAHESVAKGGLSYSYPPPPGAADSSDSTPSAALPYPPVTPHLTRAPLQILTKDPALGRGVFASQDIPAGQIVEISPVLVLSEKEYRGFDPRQQQSAGELKGVEASQLRGYVFTWGKSGEMAVALGLGSLFNHSPSPNVSYEIKTSEYTIHYRAAKPIKAGDELFIFYGHSVRFAGDVDSGAVDDQESVDDGWGGLGNIGDDVDPQDKAQAETLQMTEEELHERDNEIIGFDEPHFPFRKITEIIDPEDAELSTFPCWAIDLPARHSGIIFQFVRKHTSRKFNELQHLKRVRPMQNAVEEATLVETPCSTATETTESQTAEPQRKGTLAADTPVSILLFPVATAPSDLVQLLASSALTQALAPEPIPALYTVDVPAQAAHTEKQAEDWNKVWPVTLVHIREGPKATMKKKGWERAKIEWSEKEIERVWTSAKEAGKRGENPIACHVTDSWCPTYHSSLRPPTNLADEVDTRLSTHNCFSHAATNAIDAVSVLDLDGTRPQLSPEAVDPPYLMTGLTVFISHEPCLMCAMALLHSRVAQLYYVKNAPGSGGCGSLYKVHEDGGLNHKYEVWEWVPKDGSRIGEGIDELAVDP